MPVRCNTSKPYDANSGKSTMSKKFVTTDPQTDEENGSQQNHCKYRRSQTWAKNRRRNVFEDLGDEERVQRRLVVPDFCVELVAFEAKRGLGEFKALVRANLYSGTEGNRKLEDNESRQQGCQDDERLVTGAVRDGHLHFLTTPDFMRAPII